MYDYMYGIVTNIEESHITLEVNHIGYKIHVNKGQSYSLGCEYQIYLYQKLSEKESLLFGFSTSQNRKMFLTFLNVKGIGPQIALDLAGSDINSLNNALKNSDVNYFCTFKKVGKKLAFQIINELGTLGLENVINNSSNEEFISIIIAMGFKRQDAIEFLDQQLQELTINELVSVFLKQRQKKKNLHL